MPLINQSGYWYYDTQGSDNDIFVREHREVSMVTRIRDWQTDPTDYYLIEFKSILSLNLANLEDDIEHGILHRIRNINDNCYLILENFHEGFSNLIPEIFSYVIDR